jgi:hypothetical protein
MPRPVPTRAATQAAYRNSGFGDFKGSRPFGRSHGAPGVQRLKRALPCRGECVFGGRRGRAAGSCLPPIHRPRGRAAHRDAETDGHSPVRGRGCREWGWSTCCDQRADPTSGSAGGTRGLGERKARAERGMSSPSNTENGPGGAGHSRRAGTAFRGVREKRARDNPDGVTLRGPGPSWRPTQCVRPCAERAANGEHGGPLGIPQAARE